MNTVTIYIKDNEDVGCKFNGGIEDREGIKNIREVDLFDSEYNILVKGSIEEVRKLIRGLFQNTEYC